MNNSTIRLLMASAALAAVPSIHALRVETAPVDIQVDAQKLLTVVGDGDSQAAVVMRWNDGIGVENITAAVRFNAAAGLTPADILGALYDADWRFYRPAEGSGYCFDLNGDGITADTETDGSLQDNSQYYANDHRGIEGDAGEWVLTSASATVADGDVILAEFIPAGGESDFSGTPFYLPAADKIGVWVVEGQSFALADATYAFPVYVNLGRNTYSSISWGYYNSADGKGSNSKVLSVSTSKTAKLGNTVMTLTTKGEGSIYLRSRLSYKVPGNTRTQNSDYLYTAVTVEPPVRPLQSVTFKDPVLEAKMSHNYDLNELIVCEPADYTYSGGLSYTYTRTTPSIIGVSGSTLYTYTVEGENTVTVKSKAYQNLTSDLLVKVALRTPVEKISFLNIDPAQGVEVQFDPYKMQYNMSAAFMKVEPEDADVSKLKLVIDETDAAVNADGKVGFNFGGRSENIIYYEPVTTYLENDNAYDLSVWALGTSKVHFEATDGSGVKSEPFTVRAVERYINVDDDFQDGTFWLNEEWYTHCNGSINYLDADGNMNYRVYNFVNQKDSETPRYDTSFGATSQYGMIFGDRLYVMSKQEHDPGDNYLQGGGRLVIADAKTLRRLHSFDVLGGTDRGGDGRACVGVSADKVYLGLHNSIRVLDIDNDAATPEEMFTLGKELFFSEAGGNGSLTPGDTGGALYSNQIGDMVCAGGHVFAVMQDKGILVIDAQTDELVKVLGDANAQAVTQSADGNIWYALNDKTTRRTTLYCIDPETLEERGSYLLPESAGNINTGWGAWRSANFFASRDKNVLFWSNVGSGYQDDILGAGTGKIFRWEIGTDLPDAPFFDLGQTPGRTDDLMQVPYATMRYDDRNNTLLMATTHGASFNYRWNWLYFIDGETGEIKEVKTMPLYFWFPSIPIFPDKHLPELTLENINVEHAGDEVTLDLSEYLTDRDNIDRNIKVTLAASDVARAADEIASYELEGKTLRVAGLSKGSTRLNLEMESNGRKSSKEVVVNVDGAGIGETAVAAGSIYVSAGELTVAGFAGYEFGVYDLGGSSLRTFGVSAPRESFALSLPAGVYVVKGTDGINSISRKVIVR